MFPLRAFSVLCLALLGCDFEKLPLEGLECPCGEGFTCNESTGVCVEGFLRPDAGLDVQGVDAATDPSTDNPDSGADAASDPGGSDTRRDTGADAGMDAVDSGPGTGYCTDHSEALFCDDFEGPLPPNYTDDGTVDLVATEVYSGTRSLRAATTANGGEARVESELFSPALTSGQAFIQLRAFVVDDFAIDGFVLTEFLSGGAAGATMSILGERGVQSYFGETGHVATNSSFLVPRNAWICVRIELTIDAVAGSVRILIDDSLVTSSASLDTLPPMGMTKAAAGLPFTNPGQGPATVYVDNFIVTTEPIDCDD